jgi:hypothetical protein
MLKLIDDYSFDRQSNARPIKKIDLSKNRIVKMAAKAFCSMNTSSPYTNVKEIDLANNPLQSINACIVRQLAKGFGESTSSSQSSQAPLKPKLSFKPTHFAEKLTPSLKCDCEITKSAQFVDLEGECENTAGVLVPLKQFKCNSNDLDLVDDHCAKMSEYDCTMQTSLKSDESSDSSSNNKQPLVNPNSGSSSTNSKKPNNQEQTSQRDKQSGGQITRQPGSALESHAIRLASGGSSVAFVFLSVLFALFSSRTV